QITRAAARAEVVGSGFAGVCVDDMTPDTLIVRDRGSGKTHTVALANGMTLQQIVDALNAEFATATRRTLAASTTLYAAADGSAVVDASTTLASLFNADGTSAGIADGTVFTFSGRRANGESFLATFTVQDASTQTLGSL